MSEHANRLELGLFVPVWEDQRGQAASWEQVQQLGVRG